MSPASKAVEVKVDGRVLKLTNLDKVLWPEVGFTKGQMIDYYTRVAPALLPHLKDRPLTLKRSHFGVALCRSLLQRLLPHAHHRFPSMVLVRRSRVVTTAGAV